MTWEDKILQRINEFPGLSDRELREYFKVSNQTINAPCRKLEQKGFIVRQFNPEKNMIGNYPKGEAPKQKPKERIQENHEALTEEDIKTILTEKLISDGWEVKTAWGKAHGVDIDAKRGSEKWFIEVKGPGSRPEMRVNYFIGILGETLQRMDDPDARYSISFPDMIQYRNLWAKLPTLAKERTGIDLILVDKNATIDILK